MGLKNLEICIYRNYVSYKYIRINLSELSQSRLRLKPKLTFIEHFEFGFLGAANRSRRESVYYELCLHGEYFVPSLVLQLQLQLKYLYAQRPLRPAELLMSN